jgi:hypothetical protein
MDVGMENRNEYSWMFMRHSGERLGRYFKILNRFVEKRIKCKLGNFFFNQKKKVFKRLAY